MATKIPEAPKVGMVSLGCPKNLVDSERILTKLRSDGYLMSADYAGADVVLVNTCGFLDSAKEESLEAIGEAIAENGRVIVTGCMGDEAELIRQKFPQVLAVTGAHQYEQVVNAVHDASPPVPNAFVDLVPEGGLKLTPRHYSYLKISEGCNHRCSFCIIPSIRGDLVSRRVDAVLREAEKTGTRRDEGTAGHQSGYIGLWRRYPARAAQLEGPRSPRAHDRSGPRAWSIAHGRGQCALGAPALCLPLPHVDHVIPLMAEGLLTPYLDIPFQHASPNVLKAMKRPANEAKVLDRIRKWRDICPDIAIRSSFVVGFPGETEADFQYLLDWLDEAQLDRVGAFRFEPVEGAAANDLPGAVPEAVKEERYQRIMEKTAAISAAKLAAKVGRVLPVIVDEVGEPDEDGSIGATARSQADAPEIDGNVFLRDVGEGRKAGDVFDVRIEDADEHDLFGVPTA